MIRSTRSTCLLVIRTRSCRGPEDPRGEDATCAQRVASSSRVLGDPRQHAQPIRRVPRERDQGSHPGNRRGEQGTGAGSSSCVYYPCLIDRAINIRAVFCIFSLVRGK